MAALFAVVARPRLDRLFLVCLGVLLIGYAFLGRGFAHIGVAPVFVGEAVLALGLLAAVSRGGALSALRSPVSWLLVAFASWGAVRTVPYLGAYGVDALRDGVIWGYGVFALLVASFLLRTKWVDAVPERYARWLPLFLLWAPLAHVVSVLLPAFTPMVPGTQIPLLQTKPGDTAVHLAGAYAFLALGLHRGSGADSPRRLSVREWAWWGAWLAGLLAVGSASRSGLLAVLAVVSLLICLRPLSGWWRPAVLGTLVAMVLTVVGPEVSLGVPRTISAGQIAANIQSIFGASDADFLEGSRRWRLSWWDSILGYTLFGEHFWLGKGFGVNLADDDGYQVTSDGSLRSPHNGHLTILARAGVPGLVLWAALQGAFALSLLSSYYRARRLRQHWWARLDLWILAYWAAFMVNGAFDVFLEGPQGGIWFWSLFGIGMAAVAQQRGHDLVSPHPGKAVAWKVSSESTDDPSVRGRRPDQGRRESRSR